MSEEEKDPEERLAGDVIADFIEDQVLKRLRRLIEINSTPCNTCIRRKQKLNQLHKRWKAITGKDFNE